MLKLTELLKYSSITIQCHDNPDADALGCAYALQRYIEDNGGTAEIVYGGFAPIAKSNLTLLLDALHISARYIGRKSDLTLPEGQLLLTVDCQHGAGNVTPVGASAVAVLDHHIVEAELPAMSDVRAGLGSCSTLVWLLLCEAEYPLREHMDVATALYYGLYTDTNSLAEIIHPLDKDMRDSLQFDTGLIKKLKNSNLSISDLSIAGNTLVRHRLDETTRCAVFEAEPCDPNILGFTSDLALQVDVIDACVVFCKVTGGVKLSVRSCVREIMANELVARLCQGVGSGGGHKDKAGGFLGGGALEALGMEPADFLLSRMRDYFTNYDLVYCDRLGFDKLALPRYRKKPLPLGFVRTEEVFPAGTPLAIRTLEGDAFTISGEDVYIMVGVQQEVYPIKRAKFEGSYKELTGDYAPDPRFVP